MAVLRKQLGVLWFFIAFVHVLHGQKLWRCTGPQSKYTYLDCETDYSFSDGCYYVKHFSQFRPCGWICNDIEFNSIDEERCRAFCSGYLTSSCLLIDQTSQQPASTTTKGSYSRPPMTEQVTFRSQSEKMNTSMVVLLVVVLVVVVTSGVVLAVSIYCKKRNEVIRNNISETGELCTPTMTCQMLEDEKGWLNTEQTDNKLNTTLTENIDYEESFSNVKCQNPQLHGVD